MRRGQQQVQHDDPVPVGGQPVGHVGPDEAGSSGQQYPHPAERSRGTGADRYALTSHD